MSDGTLTWIGLFLFVLGIGGSIYGWMYLSGQIPLPTAIGLLLFLGGIVATALGMEILAELGIHPHF